MRYTWDVIVIIQRVQYVYHCLLSIIDRPECMSNE